MEALTCAWHCITYFTFNISPSYIAFHSRFYHPSSAFIHKDLYLIFSSICLVPFISKDSPWALIFRSKALRAKNLKRSREGDFCL